MTWLLAVVLGIAAIIAADRWGMLDPEWPENMAALALLTAAVLGVDRLLHWNRSRKRRVKPPPLPR